jgi:hypothetical protein
MVISRVRDLLAGKREAGPGAKSSRAAAAPAPAVAPVESSGSLEDYFDRLDAALASKGAPVPTFDPLPVAKPVPSMTPRPTLTVVPSAVAARPSPHADLDLTGWNPSTPVEPEEKAAPSAPAEDRQPASPPPVRQAPPVQSPPTEPAPQLATTVAPVSPVTAVNPVSLPSPVSLDQAFAALLAAEQGQAHVPPGQAEPASRGWADPVPDAVIDTVVGKVIARMGDEKMRAVVLDAAERLVREEIDRIKNAR